MSILEGSSRYLFATTDDLAYSEILYKFGFGMLKKNMRLAAKVMIEGTRVLSRGPQHNWAKGRDEEFEFAITLVNGTGLNILIEQFGLEVDPESFRETFLDWVSYQRRLCQRGS